MSLPSLAEVEHADWAALQRLCADLGLNPKGRSSVVRLRVLDHVRRRARPELWRPGSQAQAALLTRLGHPDTASRLWESTIQLDEPAPWIGLGRAQLGAGDLTEAAKSFERAVQMGDAGANLHRGEALAAAGDYEAAVRACDAYLAARPGELRGLLLKANFLARGGWTSEAAAVLRNAFESHPDARELWEGLGTLLLRAGRSEPAAEAYREAIRASPDDAWTWVNRGAALLLAGRVRDAVGLLRELLEKNPRQAPALNNLGVAYLREGRAKSAAVNIERAAKHLETPQILRNLALLREGARGRPAPPRARPVGLRRQLQRGATVAPNKRTRAPRHAPRARHRRTPRRPRKTKRPPVKGRRPRRASGRRPPRRKKPKPKRASATRPSARRHSRRRR